MKGEWRVGGGCGESAPSVGGGCGESVPRVGGRLVRV